VRCITGLADAEILSKARRAGAKIVEVPVSHFPRGGGRPVFESRLAGKLCFVKPGVVIDLVKDMVRLKREFRGSRDGT